MDYSILMLFEHSTVKALCFAAFFTLNCLTCENQLWTPDERTYIRNYNIIATWNIHSDI